MDRWMNEIEYNRIEIFRFYKGFFLKKKKRIIIIIGDNRDPWICIEFYEMKMILKTYFNKKKPKLKMKIKINVNILMSHIYN